MFVTLEGLDGSGKTTIITHVAIELELHTDREIIITREPGGTEVAEQLRKMFLHGEAISPITESLMVAAGRADHVDKVIKPALERGAIILSDRYFDSSVAYQGFARNAGFEKVLDINLWAIQNQLPDLTFFISSDPATSLSRVSDPDRLESFGLELQIRARQAYERLAKMYPERYRVIEAGTPIEKIPNLIVEQIVEELGAELV